MVDERTEDHLFVVVPLEIGDVCVAGVRQVLLENDVVGRMTAEDDVQQGPGHPRLVFVSVHHEQVVPLPVSTDLSAAARPPYLCATEK